MDDPENNACLIATLIDSKNDVCLDDIHQNEKSETSVDAVIKTKPMPQSVDIDDKKEMTQIPDIADVSENFWSNEIIWELVTSYLNISDLKNFSCTNSYFQQRVRSLSRFSSLSGQVVIDNMKIDVFKLTRAVVKVKKININALEQLSAETFEDTEYLEIHCVGQLSVADLNSRLIQIVSNCPKLKSLVFRRKSFLGKNLDVFFQNTNVRQVLSNLKELHLEVVNRCQDETEEDKEFEFALRNKEKSDILHLCKMFPDLQMKMTAFSYTEPLSLLQCWFSPRLALSSSQNTLVKLELKMPPKRTLLIDLASMEFPRLEKFKLDIYASKFHKTLIRYITGPDYFTSIMIRFLKTHLSTLTEFELSYDGKLALSPFQGLFRSSTKIKKLVFTIPDQEIVFGYSEWDFLNTNAELQSFELKLSWEKTRLNEVSTCNSFIDYLNVLPSTIKSIKFRNVIVRDVGPQPLLMSRIISSLMRFHNVTELKLLLCLDDQVLGFICKHFFKLRIFEADFTFVSDRGICGGLEDQDSIPENSLSNLKGLNKLVMKASYHHDNDYKLCITWDGLCRAIHFLELVELRVEASLSTPYSSPRIYYDELKMFQDRYFLQLVSSHRNPSLERVFIQWYTPDSDILEQLKTVNPRIK